MRKAVYAFVAFALVALGVAAYPRASKPALAVSSDLRAELARLQGELEDERTARQREIAKLEAQLRVLATSAAQEHDGQPSAAAPAAAVLELTKPAAQEPPEPIDPGEHLENAFADQSTDAAWASTTEAHIAQKVRAGLPNARLQAIECHASMCRLETVHADAAAYGQFVNESKRLWSGDAYSAEPTEGAQGQMVVVSYLAREGETLPQLR